MLLFCFVKYNIASDIINVNIDAFCVECSVFTGVATYAVMYRYDSCARIGRNSSLSY